MTNPTPPPIQQPPHLPPHLPPNHPPHILYQNAQQTITLIDIPRSIEDAQYLSSKHNPIPHPNITRRLISCAPIDSPYPSLEPKSKKALRNAPAKSIEDLMLERYVQLALEEMRGDPMWKGVVCLDRVAGKGKEKEGNGNGNGNDSSNKTKPQKKRKREPPTKEPINFHHNAFKVEKRIFVDGIIRTMPPKSTMICGKIPESDFNVNFSMNLNQYENFPKFSVIIVDPPWPNRSAARKDAYVTAEGSGGIAGLLRSLPIHSTSQNSYVGIWITNKPAYRALLLDDGGLFSQWGIELVEEWIWLKVTSKGEPIFDIQGTWRKPWEILLVGRKTGFQRGVERGECGLMGIVGGKEGRDEIEMAKRECGGGDGGVEELYPNEQEQEECEINRKIHTPTSPQILSPTTSSTTASTPTPTPTTKTIKRKIIIGTPDLHSRKPNLRFLFGQLLGMQKDDDEDGCDYKGLEIFARNLTAGWWGWGDEVLEGWGREDGGWREGEESWAGEEGEGKGESAIHQTINEAHGYCEELQGR
ncbi:hypothetical protein SBOR_5789 [Sclerotinia borealis F-4128]|uniref:MT-A70 family n=1 Tax=Sclerotinia borealis (strain F-4128) TaxID=1432307 RepID=W9CDE0_SCLBF|nr:hypothetical protein SBOR_5789 [Sclerotinia borealis F-4128]